MSWWTIFQMIQSARLRTEDGGFCLCQLTVLLQDVTLALRDALDPASLDLACCSEETLPSRDGVGADQRAVEQSD